VENRANDAGDVKNAVDASGNLTVNGTGSLLVNSVKNGIAGNSIAIKDATVSVTAEKDGLHAEIGAYDDLTEAPVFSYADGGYVHLDGAKLTVVSADDGIQADTFVLITGESEVNATANGGAPATITESSSDSASGKGIKAGSLDWGADGNELSGVDYLVLIESGTIAVDSNDDGIHSDGIVEINGGTITLSTGDDGVHAESLLAVNGGSVTVSRSYEGLEGAKVEIADGRIDVTATDDGINAADGTSGGFGFSAANANCHLIVSGGEVRVNAQGDGLDSNGTMLIEGGVVLVSGPTNGGNAALDSDGGILVNGGYLFAVGPLGMVETPATNSEQNVLSYAHQSVLAADTLLSLTDGEGNTLFSFLSPKTCQSVILSCPELETGGTYSIYGGDTLLCTFTVSSRITTVGSSGSIGNPGGRPGKR
ncbi:MAG: carbohydrate-binding domain-containing protein, partial [Candidatus Gallimonas sp.]